MDKLLPPIPPAPTIPPAESVRDAESGWAFVVRVAPPALPLHPTHYLDITALAPLGVHWGSQAAASAAREASRTRCAEAIEAASARVWGAWEAQVAAVAAWEAQRADLLARVRAEGQPVYVRWGAPPAGGRSRDYREGRLEAGVAVYQAYIWGGRIVLPLDGVDAASAMFIIGHGQMYIVEGERVGTTSDGTPAIRMTTARRSRRRVEVIV